MGGKKILQDKNIIVTGTARGMGKKMTETFALQGGNVFACARMKTEEHEAYCMSLAKEHHVQVIPVYFDLKEPEQIKNAVKEIRGYKMPIDGLVNNAGIIYNGLFHMTSIEELRNQFEVNFFAPFLFTQYISKLMVRNRKGSIVSIASIVALDGNAGKSAYGASKAALICMTKCIAEELGESGVRANVICPGIVDTDMLTSMPDYMLESQIEAAFLKKAGTTSDIANTALFLLSDYASYITGQALRVDGGITEYCKKWN